MYCNMDFYGNFKDKLKNSIRLGQPYHIRSLDRVCSPEKNKVILRVLELLLDRVCGDL